MRALLLALAVVAVSGCGSTQLVAKHYDQTCTAAADCVPAFFGDACAVCTCVNGAINQSAKTVYDGDAQAAHGWCGAQPKVLCGPCQEPVVDCLAGACVLKQ